MKNLTRLLLLVFIVSSCAVNQDVTNGSWIQKRKYTKGFHLSTKSDQNKKHKVDKKDDIEEHVAVNSNSEKKTSDESITTTKTKNVEQTFRIENSEKSNDELVFQNKSEKSNNSLKEKSTPVIEGQSETTASVKKDSEIENTSTSFRERMIEKYESIYGVSDKSENKVDSEILMIIGIILCLVALSPLGVYVVKGGGSDFTLNLLIWLIAILLMIFRAAIWTGFGFGYSLAGLVMLFAVVHGILVILDII